MYLLDPLDSLKPIAYHGPHGTLWSSWYNQNNKLTLVLFDPMVHHSLHGFLWYPMVPLIQLKQQIYPWTSLIHWTTVTLWGHWASWTWYNKGYKLTLVDLPTGLLWLLALHGTPWFLYFFPVPYGPPGTTKTTNLPFDLLDPLDSLESMVHHGSPW